MDIRAILMGLAFAFMWSSAFTSARIIVADASPLWTLSLRFLLSGLLALVLGRALGGTLRLSRAQWIAVAVFGICQNALYLGLNFVAMQTIEASLAAIIASSLPLWVALAGWIVFRESTGWLGTLGLIAGFAGVALVMGGRISAGVDLFGVVLCGFGVLALTVATLAMRGTGSGGNVLAIVGLQMLVGSTALGGYALLFEPFRMDPTWRLLGAFAYTTLVPGLLATWVWFLLVNRIGATRAATFHFLNPFLGLVIAAVVLSEAMTFTDFGGVLVITAGIFAVQLSGPAQKWT